ncbi:hypothetical protein C1752_00201 [Acaryochloris thomasi RCC1774]|uniref:Uncharacterized protein n=1 Tax=Acaryochloris thomasi RCC1774 TaxID=1764569 RepID=A0A2W1JYT4_9CYAN|nr:hypothetical protein [Acaryochloris thomasi]PZD75375.1 hypothetical protein C1752_00201 [Acaryochloris thomasi RCC1774]
MQPISSFKKTILAVLVGTSIVSVTTLPVRANEDSWVSQSRGTQPVFSQNPSTFSNRPSDTGSVEDFTKVIGIFGLAMGTGMIGWHLTHSRRSSLSDSIFSINSRETSMLGHVNPKLKQKLLRLVHNQQTASRLLSSASLRYADRSPNWLAEKVIYDLQRDRA